MDFILFLSIAPFVIFSLYVAQLPSAYRINRYATVSAPADLVFEQVNNFHNWQAWSPWASLDPNANTVFEGPISGVGAIYRWSGNKQIGAGNMTILESQSGQLIRIRLEFIRPQPGVCLTEFTFEADSGGTVVCWSMSGHNNFITRAVFVFVSMDKIVGSMFEQGLDNLRTLMEAPQEQRSDK